MVDYKKMVELYVPAFITQYTRHLRAVTKPHLQKSWWNLCSERTVMHMSLSHSSTVHCFFAYCVVVIVLNGIEPAGPDSAQAHKDSSCDQPATLALGSRAWNWVKLVKRTNVSKRNASRGQEQANMRSSQASRTPRAHPSGVAFLELRTLTKIINEFQLSF